MSTITPSAATSTAGSASASTAAAGGLGSAAAATGADYDDFLTLLTAQLRNQDPLNPQDSTEFVAQIAQFTSVEQALATNQKLDSLIALQTGGDLTTLGGWIGRSITASDAAFPFDGDSLSVTVPADAGADNASVVIRDLAGKEVATLPASPKGGTVTWDGKGADGVTRAEGLYRVDFVYGSAGQDGPETRTVKAEGAGRVVEVRLSNGVAELVLDNGAVVDPTKATALRDIVDAGADADAGLL